MKQVNFKILHNIFPLKHNLCRWRIMENDQCDICKETETTFHVLLKCNKVRIFKKIIGNLYYNQFHEQININEKALVIGYFIEKKENCDKLHVNLRTIHNIHIVY